MTETQERTQCMKDTKSGAQCKNKALPDSFFCKTHQIVGVLDEAEPELTAWEKIKALHKPEPVLVIPIQRGQMVQSPKGKARTARKRAKQAWRFGR